MSATQQCGSLQQKLFEEHDGRRRVVVNIDLLTEPVSFVHRQDVPDGQPCLLHGRKNLLAFRHRYPRIIEALGEE